MGHYDEQYEAEDFKRAKKQAEERVIAAMRLNDALAILQGGEKSRENSIAITHIETAILWLRK